MESKKRNTLVAICSGGALLIGIAAIIVPLIASSGATTTSKTSVEVRTTPSATPAVAAEVDESIQVIGTISHPALSGDPAQSNLWRIPVDAPLATMPAGEQCGAEQRAWLLEHAEPASPTGRFLDVQVRNAATDGGSMSIGNIHADGDLIESSQIVTLQCAGIGGGGSQLISLTLDGSPGVWGPPTGWEDNEQPEGSLATLNLAPGELAELSFIIADETRRFEGRIAADLIAPETGSVVLADALVIEPTPVPGYYLSFANGPLECTRPDQPRTTCSLAEAEQLLREAARS